MRAMTAMLVAVGIFPSGTFALEVEQCSEAGDLIWPHEGEGDYENFGRGLVSYFRGGGFEGVSANDFFFVNCKTGETIRSRVFFQQGTEVRLDRGGAVQAKLREMIEAPTVYSFANVRDELNKLGVKADLWTSTEEVCACKALYPEARGQKKAYVFEPQFFVDPEPDHTGRDE
jgi:hypothetical protein